MSPLPEQSTAEPAQMPEVQTSVVVQRSVSSQVVPSATGIATQPPAAASQTPVLQASVNAEQSTAAPPTQTPVAHMSPMVQTSPSSQPVPSATGTAVHAPVAASHVPVLQASVIAEQSTGVPAVQVPALQLSPVVQPSPSSQPVPSATGVASQAPVAGLHVPVLQSSSSALQSTPAHMSPPPPSVIEPSVPPPPPSVGVVPESVPPPPPSSHPLIAGTVTASATAQSRVDTLFIPVLHTRPPTPGERRLARLSPQGATAKGRGDNSRSSEAPP